VRATAFAIIKAGGGSKKPASRLSRRLLCHDDVPDRASGLDTVKALASQRRWTAADHHGVSMITVWDVMWR